MGPYGNNNNSSTFHVRGTLLYLRNVTWSLQETWETGTPVCPHFCWDSQNGQVTRSQLHSFTWQSQDLNPGCLVPGPALTSWVETSSSHLCCGITNVQGPRELWFKDHNAFALDTEDGHSPRKPPRSLLGTTNVTNLAFERQKHKGT